MYYFVYRCLYTLIKIRVILFPTLCEYGNRPQDLLLGCVYLIFSFVNCLPVHVATFSLIFAVINRSVHVQENPGFAETG